jgi:hypothetical protein
MVEVNGTTVFFFHLGLRRGGVTRSARGVRRGRLAALVCVAPAATRPVRRLVSMRPISPPLGWFIAGRS